MTLLYTMPVLIEFRHVTYTVPDELAAFATPQWCCKILTRSTAKAAVEARCYGCQGWQWATSGQQRTARCWQGALKG